jgi:hypothetical protein
METLEARDNRSEVLESDAPRELRELMDRAEITDLVTRLGHWLDEKRFDEAREIFAAEVTVETPGGRAQGMERLVEQARRNHEPFEQMQHVITNVLVDLAGDRAAVRANLIATLVPRADAPDRHFDVGERYGFEAVRTPAGWRLSEVRVTPVWTAGSRES